MNNKQTIKNGVIYDKNPLNELDQLFEEKGVASHEKFRLIDFLPTQRKDRKDKYLISSYGRIFDVSTGKQIEPIIEHKGKSGDYKKISLYLEQGGYKKYDVKVLVAEGFVIDNDRYRLNRTIVFALDRDNANVNENNLIFTNNIERWIMTSPNTNKDVAIKSLAKRGYTDGDIKTFLSKRVKGMSKITLKYIRSVMKVNM